jgi:hypothetical protein
METLDRRTLIKAAAVAGVGAWTAPVILDSLSSPAAAISVPGAACPDGQALGESYTTGDDDHLDSWQDFSVAQSFTPAVNHGVTKVRLLLYQVGPTPPASMVVQIFNTTVDATKGTVPTGSALGTSALVLVAALTTNTAGAWVDFTFATPVCLTASTKYAIVLNPTNGAGNTTNFIAWRVDTAGAYAGGSAARSASSGSWTDSQAQGEIPADDLMFEEYGCTPCGT